MKIVYFGSDVFLPCFEYFLERHEVLALYTYHHDEDYMTEAGITRQAREAGIPIHYESIPEGEIRRYFAEEGCELFFVAEYDRLIPVPEDLEGFRGVNLHSSLLPEGRSYYPIEAAMDRGLKRTGITIHRLAPTLDHGNILDQQSVEIRPDMDSIDVYLEVSKAARRMTEKMMDDFENMWEKAWAQPDRAPYWKRPETARLTLTHGMTRAEAREMFRRFNSLSQTLLDGKLHYIFSLNTGSSELPRAEWPLGENRWLYALKDGHARLCVMTKTGDDRK